MPTLLAQAPSPGALTRADLSRFAGEVKMGRCRSPWRMRLLANAEAGIELERLYRAR